MGGSSWLILAVILALALAVVCYFSAQASIMDPCEQCMIEHPGQCPCLPEGEEPISEDHWPSHWLWMPVVAK